MRFLTLAEILELHRLLIESSGGATGVRDFGALESAVAQPRVTFAGEELYSSIEDKAAALGYSLILNHPFLDGNKRVGHAALETFMLLNGFELNATVDDSEAVTLSVANGEYSRERFVEWLKNHTEKAM